MSLRVVVSPVIYNEAGKTERVIERLAQMQAKDPDVAIHIVDDGSSDGSRELIRASGLPATSHARRLGVGCAVTTAIEYACDHGFDVVVIMAGNDKDRPSEVRRLIAKVEEGFDFVVGSRYFPGGREENTPAYRVLATKYVHPFIVWLTTGKRLSDTSTGFRAIRTDVFKDARVRLRQDWLTEYDCEMYILYKVLTLGYRVAEVPASKIYPPHKLGYTKMKPISGWWKMLRAFFWLRLGIKT